MEKLVLSVKEEKTHFNFSIACEKVEKPDDKNLGEDEVLVKILAAPINPTDVASIYPMGSDISKIEQGDNKLAFPLSLGARASVKKVIDSKGPVGSEACGEIIASGTNFKNKIGRIISFVGSPSSPCGQYTLLNLKLAPHIIQNEGVNVEHAAAAIVNPLTVCGFVDTVKKGNHKAVIHTAAASNLGKMLIKLCNKEKIPIICIVRKEAQVKELKDLGADYAVNSESDSFHGDLVEACKATGATCAFDAVGGGNLAYRILLAMEEAIALENEPAEKKYGSSVPKQVYIYGFLDRTDTVIGKGHGMCWSIGGFLVFNWFTLLTPEEQATQWSLIRDNLSTIFESNFGVKMSLKDFMKKDNFLSAIKQTTANKTLLLPHGEDALAAFNV